MKPRDWKAGFLIVLLVYLHNTLPYLTMMPRVNVDEPWLMERAYQVMQTGIPSQPMLGLRHAYLLQVGYGYLLALWMALAGVGVFQARLLGVVLGLAIVGMVAVMGRRTIDPITGLSAALFLALDSNFLRPGSSAPALASVLPCCVTETRSGWGSCSWLGICSITGVARWSSGSATPFSVAC